MKVLHSAYYDTIYDYTTSKLEKLMSHEAFTVVFRKFVADGNFELALRNDPTMKANPDIFRKKLNQLIKKLNQPSL